MTTFRDRITSALTAPHPRHQPPHRVQIDDATRVLAMPEMQAIRYALCKMATDLASGCYDNDNHGESVQGGPHGWLTYWLPEGMDHIVDWVMGEEVPRG